MNKLIEYPCERCEHSGWCELNQTYPATHPKNPINWCEGFKEYITSIEPNDAVLTREG